MRITTIYGLTEQEAVEFCEALRYQVRIVMRDGVPLNHDLRYVPDRISLTIKSNKVIYANIG